MLHAPYFKILHRQNGVVIVPGNKTELKQL